MIKRYPFRFVYLLVITTLQVVVPFQSTQATNISKLERRLTGMIQDTCDDGYCTNSKPQVRLFQTQRASSKHPITNFCLIYDPEVDIVYLNTQKIDARLMGNLVEAIYIARQRRESYLDSRLQRQGEKYLAYLRGENGKRVYRRFNGTKSPNPAATQAWNERNAEFMMPTNNKVASYKIVALEPFQEPLSIAWKTYLPHCSAVVSH